MSLKIGVADTTFARADMAKIARQTIERTGQDVVLERYTVPGIKDLPVACKKLIEEKNCSAVIALGMPGKTSIDKQCAHEASMGLIQVQLLTNTHVIEVFAHEDEAKNDKELLEIAFERTRKHALNALELVKSPLALAKNAGGALRQGKENAKTLS